MKLSEILHEYEVIIEDGTVFVLKNKQKSIKLSKI